MVPTPPADTVPDAPGQPESTALSSSSILWRWDLVGDDGGAMVTGYVLQWRVQGQSWSGNMVSLTEGCYRQTGLSANTTYEIRVAAVNSVGQSTSWSPTEDATTQVAIPQEREFTSSQTFIWPYSATRGVVELRDSAQAVIAGTTYTSDGADDDVLVDTFDGVTVNASIEITIGGSGAARFYPQI